MRDSIVRQTKSPSPTGWLPRDQGVRRLAEQLAEASHVADLLGEALRDVDLRLVAGELLRKGYIPDIRRSLKRVRRLVANSPDVLDPIDEFYDPADEIAWHLVQVERLVTDRNDRGAREIRAIQEQVEALAGWLHSRLRPPGRQDVRRNNVLAWLVEYLQGSCPMVEERNVLLAAARLLAAVGIWEIPDSLSQDAERELVEKIRQTVSRRGTGS